MPPSRSSSLIIPIALALLYCTLFFIIEHSRWYPLRASNFAWRESTLSTISGGGVKRPAAYIAVGVSGLLLLTKRKRRHLVINRAVVVPFMFYFVWAWMSYFWSDNPSFVLKRLISFTFIVVAAFAVSRAIPRGDFLFIIWAVTSLFLAIGLVSELKLGTLAPFSGGYRFMGTLHTESQGFNCSMAILASISLSRRMSFWSGLPYRSVALIALVSLYLTRSRGPFVGLMLAIIVYFVLTRRGSSRAGVIYAVLFSLCALSLIWGPSQLAGLALMGRHEETSTLSGRIPLWTECWNFVEERPLTGYGFNGFWTQDRAMDFSESLNWIIDSAHSIYIDSALNIGIIGLALFLMLFLASWITGVKSVKLGGENVTVFFLAILVLMLADGLLSSLVIGGGFVTFVMLAVMFYLCFSRTPTAQEREHL